MKALCCGSFDPITKGHEDIVRRAARLFDEVVVLIARNPDKTGFFSEEVRRGFCEKTFADLPNVTVDVWDGIVVDYARKVGASVLVKGIRNTADLEYETQLAEINRILAPEIETVYLNARPQLSALSSTYARAFLRSGKDCSPLLPEAILQDIEQMRK
ncbi:MAG: pantetheine-phosphate adenylyltransferase [Clostridia bacterium]|nr:pantetheine-phosphate adenylyltransferase [Clostridia bacterium]